MHSIAPFQLIPEYRDYPWGGDRLRPGHYPTSEAWVVWQGDFIAVGPLAGLTLGEAVERLGPAILGRRGLAAAGGRFPLLIKLLDCAQWLSLQVHPDNAAAARLEGPGASGKAESWHILETGEGAELIAGLKPGTTRGAVAAALGNRGLLDLAQRHPVRPGDTLHMPPGTVHALGPGLLLYEVQQSSDITYRAYDWEREQTGGRRMHLDEARAVIDPALQPHFLPASALTGAPRQVLSATQFFTLELLQPGQPALEMDPAGESFHALTVIAGAANLLSGETRLDLRRYETALVPAGAGPYWLEAGADTRVLLARA